MQSNLETCIQRLLECVGPTLGGQVTWQETRKSPNDHSTDITVTVSCARNSSMEATTEASPKPSPCKPPSPSPSLSDFSLSTSRHFLPIYDGTNGPMINYEELDSLLRSQGVGVGSSVDVLKHPLSGRLSLTIHREA